MVKPGIASPRLKHTKYGCWCAWCLKYIERRHNRIKKGQQKDPEALENHHVEQEAIGRRFSALSDPLEYEWNSWIVPAHYRCHRNKLDNYSKGAGELMLGVTNMEPDYQDRLAARLFNSGLYPFSVRLRQNLRHYSAQQGDYDQQRLNFRYELISAAGVWLFRVDKFLEFISRKDPILGPNALSNPVHTSYLINPLATFGMVAEARKFLSEIEILTFGQ